MKAIAIISGIIFLVFTVVQFNDPDPLYWIFIYLLTAGFSFAAFFNRFYPKLMLLAIGMYLNAAFGLWAGVVEWFHSPDRTLLFDDIAKMNELKKFWNEYKVYIQNDMLWTLLAMIATFALAYLFFF